MTTPPATARRVVVDLPLPPKSLGKGASVHWWEYRPAYAEHREFAGYAIRDKMNVECIDLDDGTRCLVMDIAWSCTYGRIPDDDNITTRCAAYRDGAQDAELVLDDSQITIGTVTTERVKRGSEGVRLTFREAT